MWCDLKGVSFLVEETEQCRSRQAQASVTASQGLWDLASSAVLASGQQMALSPRPLKRPSPNEALSAARE